MKAFMIKNEQIMSLENIKEIHLSQNSCGDYYIEISYTNGETASSYLTSDIEEAKGWLYEMYLKIIVN